MIIRDERRGDALFITEVTIAAFRDHPHSRQTEQFIVRSLRAAGALSVSLVAEIEDAVAGHIAFSPVEMTDGTSGWYGLGPVSVLPEHQRQGIGRALVLEGLSRLKHMRAQGGCVLVGDPAYYARFGFRNVPSLVYAGVAQELFLALPFGGHVPEGEVFFHRAFEATS